MGLFACFFCSEPECIARAGVWVLIYPLSTSFATVQVIIYEVMKREFEGFVPGLVRDKQREAPMNLI